MITCPQCQHANPEGATHCEACFEALPHLVPCPHCGGAVQSDATFCGQCGNVLSESSFVNAVAPSLVPEPVIAEVMEPVSSPVAEPISAPITEPIIPEVTSSPFTPPVEPVPVSRTVSTQLQQEAASLFHVQSQTTLALPTGLAIIHIGKPNERIPPDIDLSGFSNSDVVSRVHADIRVEGDQYFLEDVGSANGTYVNHTPLTPGNRHRLRAGDRLSFGKGDLVSLIFQLS